MPVVEIRTMTQLEKSDLPVNHYVNAKKDLLKGVQENNSNRNNNICNGNGNVTSG